MVEVERANAAQASLDRLVVASLQFLSHGLGVPLAANQLKAFLAKNSTDPIEMLRIATQSQPPKTVAPHTRPN